MKRLLLMAVVGSGLFIGTILGLLGAQGRLNYEGTQGIPVLHSLFPKPEVAEGDAEIVEGEQQTPATEGATERPIEYVVGSSVDVEPGQEAEGSDGAADGSKPTSEGENPEGTQDEAVDEEEQEQARMQRDFERERARLQSLSSGYGRPGDLFDMRQIEAASGMAVEDINEIIQRVQNTEKELVEERAVLSKLRRDLELQSQDIADRQSRVDREMKHVVAERTKVEQMIEDFNKRVLVLSVDRESGLKEIARTVESLSPERAMELIMDYWKKPADQDKAIEILAVMDPDKADEIIGLLDVQYIREILRKKATVVRSGKK